MAAGIVLRDAGGQTLRVIGRSLGAASADAAAYRAILHGVWKAKGLGVHRIRVFADVSEVVDQLEGRVEVPASLVGLYLQTKAMLNAYRQSSVEWVEREKNAEAAVAALEALEQELSSQTADLDEIEMLPLWLSADRNSAGVGS